MAKAGNQSANFSLLLQQARAEAQADAATQFSSHLDRLTRHIATRNLSMVEVIELLTQESVKFHNVGLTRGEGC
ncbi:DUF2732 family protein [Enterobacteriaceae bacterium C34A]